MNDVARRSIVSNEQCLSDVEILDDFTIRTPSSTIQYSTVHKDSSASRPGSVPAGSESLTHE